MPYPSQEIAFAGLWSPSLFLNRTCNKAVASPHFRVTRTCIASPCGLSKKKSETVVPQGKCEGSGPPKNNSIYTPEYQHGTLKNHPTICGFHVNFPCSISGVNGGHSHWIFGSVCVDNWFHDSTLPTIPAQMLWTSQRPPGTTHLRPHVPHHLLRFVHQGRRTSWSSLFCASRRFWSRGESRWKLWARSSSAPSRPPCRSTRSRPRYSGRERPRPRAGGPCFRRFFLLAPSCRPWRWRSSPSPFPLSILTIPIVVSTKTVMASLTTTIATQMEMTAIAEKMFWTIIMVLILWMKMILFLSLELCVYGLNNHENIEDIKKSICWIP